MTRTCTLCGRPCPRQRCGRCRTNLRLYGDHLGVNPAKDAGRLPWEPLQAHLDTLGIQPGDIARHFDVSGTQVKDWKANGFGHHSADRVAIRLGTVPELIWGDQFLTDLEGAA